MRIAHLADLHLGYRAYHRQTPEGINAREADVSRAFRQAIDKIIALEPDLVLIAGDIFHVVRPANAVIANAFREFTRLRKGLGRAPIILLGGNHESPRMADTGNILDLFKEIPGVFPIARQSQQLVFEEMDLAILGVPYNALTNGLRTALEPDPAVKTNILMLHGTITGRTATEKLRYLAEHGGDAIEDRVIGPERWDYVALGHYHIMTELAPNMWYSGAIERTSTNIWAESGPKGFLMYDTETQNAEFHEIETRPMVDLPMIDAAGLAPAAIDQAMAEAIGAIPGGLAGKLVRLVITNVPQHIARELDYQKIREYRATALHFRLDLRRPSQRMQKVAQDTVGAPSVRRTLEEEVQDFLENRWAPSNSGIRKDTLIDLARAYLGTMQEVS